MKEKFLKHQSVNATEFLELAQSVDIKIPKNIRERILERVDSIQIILDNGAHRISGDRLRTNTIHAISKYIRETYLKLK